jgi:tetratricopeptide (TPR) repeat protein
MSARGKIDECHARLDACGVDPALVALCKRCLAPEKADRPADAGVVAQAVALLRAEAEERARQAEMERARTEVRAAEQHKRRRTLMFASGVLLTVLAAGMVGTTIGMFQALKAQAAEADARGKAEEARDALVLSLAAEEKARKESDESYQFAREAVLGVSADVDEVLRQAQYARAAQAKVVTRLADAVARQLDLATSRNLPEHAMHAIRIRLGDLEYRRGKLQDARPHYDESLVIAERLRGTEQREQDKAKLAHALSHSRLGELRRELGLVDQAIETFQKAETLQREVLTAPTTGEVKPEAARLQLATTISNLASTYEQRQSFALARAAAEETVRLRESSPSLLADSLIQLGEIAFRCGTMSRPKPP